jgi:hypothetical protein
LPRDELEKPMTVPSDQERLSSLEEVARLATEYLNEPGRMSPGEKTSRWSSQEVEDHQRLRAELVERLKELGYNPKP